MGWSTGRTNRKAQKGEEMIKGREDVDSKANEIFKMIIETDQWSDSKEKEIREGVKNLIIDAIKFFNERKLENWETYCLSAARDAYRQNREGSLIWLQLALVRTQLSNIPSAERNEQHIDLSNFGDAAAEQLVIDASNYLL